MKKVKINGKEYSSLKEGCMETGLNYDNIRKFKQLKGSKFSMKLVKHYLIEIGTGLAPCGNPNLKECLLAKRVEEGDTEFEEKPKPEKKGAIKTLLEMMYNSSEMSRAIAVNFANWLTEFSSPVSNGLVQYSRDGEPAGMWTINEMFDEYKLTLEKFTKAEAVEIVEQIPISPYLEMRGKDE